MSQPKKPKFKVGQVVAILRKGRVDYGELVGAEKYQESPGFNLRVPDSECEWIPIENLRPLTRREMGK